MTFFRKILFALFVLIYITVCPLLIMYSLGIIFKPTTQSIERTGVIYLSTVPSNAKVYINRKALDDSTPALITGLLPGNYYLRLTKNGYKDWYKFLPVEEQKSTSLDNIMLIPEIWPKEVMAGAYEELIPINKSPFLILRKGPLLKDIEIFHETASANLVPDHETTPEKSATENNPVALVPEDHPLANAHLLKITTVEESAHVLLSVKYDRHKYYLWAKVDAKPPEIQDISELITEEDPDIRWSKDHPGHLYFLKDNMIHYIDVEQKTSTPILSSIGSFAIYEDHLIVLTVGKLLERFDHEGQNEEIILNDPAIIKKLFEPYKNIDIHLYKDNLMVFLTEKGSLLMNQLPNLFVEEGIRGFDYRQENKRLAFWDRRDLGVIDINIRPNEALFEIGPHIRWLGIKQEDIQQALFINDGFNIIFRNNDTVFLTEVENYGQPAVNEITKIKKNSSIAFNHNENAIYFLEEMTGHLSMIKLGARNFTLPLPSNK